MVSIVLIQTNSRNLTINVFRYVLSAAHCGNKDFVRLGEWNIVDPNEFDPWACSYHNDISERKCRAALECFQSCEQDQENSNIDCSPYNRNLCAPEHQDIEISREIIHPDYHMTNIGSLDNDIMLIKLAKPAIFKEFVAPICLPDM